MGFRAFARVWCDKVQDLVSESTALSSYERVRTCRFILCVRTQISVSVSESLEDMVSSSFEAC